MAHGKDKGGMSAGPGAVEWRSGDVEEQGILLTAKPSPGCAA